MGKPIALIGSFPLTGSNEPLAEETSKVIEDSTHQSVNIIPGHSASERPVDSTLVLLAMKGSRGFHCACQSFTPHIDPPVSNASTFTRLFQKSQVRPNAVGAVILDIIPTQTNKAIDLFINNLVFHSETTGEIFTPDQTVHRQYFNNPRDPAFIGKNEFYDFDPEGTYCVRRIFCLETLKAALNPDECADKYSETFLKQYLDSFVYAIEHPLFSPPALALKSEKKSSLLL